MGQQRFKIVTTPQPKFVYGQDVPGIINDTSGRPVGACTGTIIGMRYVVCEGDRYGQEWEYEVEFEKAGGCPTYAIDWFYENQLDEPFRFTRPDPAPVDARTLDEMQRNHMEYPDVVVELNDDAFNVIGHRHLHVQKCTLVEATHAAHKEFFRAMEFVASLRYVRRVVGYPKGAIVQYPK